MNNQELIDQVAKLRSDLADLGANFYKNNFTAHQDFNKSCSFNTKVKFPVYTTLPTCEPGEVCVFSTAGTYKLMVATATDTWDVVGTQS